jgi:purine nucleoside phosphorylase
MEVSTRLAWKLRNTGGNQLFTFGRRSSVGTSTVPEAVGADIVDQCTISCVTNAAAGVLDQPLEHNDVLATAERVKDQFIGLLGSIIPVIAKQL